MCGISSFRFSANSHSAQNVSREFAGARLPPSVTPELLQLLNSFSEEVSDMTLNRYATIATDRLCRLVRRRLCEAVVNTKRQGDIDLKWYETAGNPS